MRGGNFGLQCRGHVRRFVPVILPLQTYRSIQGGEIGAGPDNFRPVNGLNFG
jgi:hypothetical protein